MTMAVEGGRVELVDMGVTGTEGQGVVAMVTERTGGRVAKEVAQSLPTVAAEMTAGVAAAPPGKQMVFRHTTILSLKMIMTKKPPTATIGLTGMRRSPKAYITTQSTPNPRNTTRVATTIILAAQAVTATLQLFSSQTLLLIQQSRK